MMQERRQGRRRGSLKGYATGAPIPRRRYRRTAMSLAVVIAWPTCRCVCSAKGAAIPS